MTRKALIGLVVVAGVVAFVALDLQRFLSPENLREQRDALQASVAAAPLQSSALFFLLYVAVTGLSLPGAAVLTLLAGGLFGFVWGTLLVSFAASVGATVAFLASRMLLRSWVQGRFGDKLRAVNAGMEREGAFYLFALRLVPLFPFVAVNLLMGLTPIRTRTFYWVSQLGMLPGTAGYVYAGAQIGDFQFSGELLLAFALLGLAPLIAKKSLDRWKAHRVYSGWARPRRFERNVVVIGAGSAGLVAAYIAASVKARVTLVEAHRMGGDCLNTGCVPSKALIRTTRFLAEAKRSETLGVCRADVSYDFAEVMERVARVVRKIEPHDSAQRFEKLGVECLRGHAVIETPWAVAVKSPDGTRRTLTTRNIIIAAGARPLIPPIPGLAEASPLTSDTVWQLRTLPGRLVVLGGGPIGSELAQCFARLGSNVTQVEMLPRLLSREDPEVSERVRARFEAEGIRVLTEHKAVEVVNESGTHTLVVEHRGERTRIAFDAILCALGRVPNTEGYGLETLGIPLDPSRTVQTNERLQTIFPNIYACGDVAGPFQFTHTASHQAWYATVNALFGRFRRFPADYSVIPWATFTEPEVARVGLNETEARERNVAYEVTTYGLDDLDRAITDEADEGFVKVLTVPGRDRILGATVVGKEAGDLIIEFILAMKHGLGLNKLLATIHIYPTMAEANKYVAGEWRRAHVSPRTLRWLERYHAWERG